MKLRTVFLVLAAFCIGLLAAALLSSLASRSSDPVATKVCKEADAPRAAQARAPLGGEPLAMAGKPLADGVPDAAPAANPMLPRKIIYNAVIDLVSDDLAKAEQEVRRLVKENKGYISKSELRGVTGSQRVGLWTIRIPVENFDPFRDAVLKLGEEQKNSLDSQDVTDQFYDLEARIKINRAEAVTPPPVTEG